MYEQRPYLQCLCYQASNSVWEHMVKAVAQMSKGMADISIAL